jgi:hypothetical protein
VVKIGRVEVRHRLRFADRRRLPDGPFAAPNASSGVVQRP